MKDVMEELTLTRRELGKGDVPAGPARTVVLRRRYDAEVEDVWDALTSPDRLRRWFLPVTGDLEPGGAYLLEGGTGGTILGCEPPRLLRVSWLFGPEARPGTSEVEVRLAPDPAGGVIFELTHAAVIEEEFFGTYGPGAVGVGWDLSLLALSRYLAGEDLGNPADFESSPAARGFSTASAASWGEAHRAAGGDPDRVTAAVAATTAFYVPEAS